MIAPIPAALALFGLSCLHTRYKIKPTIGKQKPNRPQPNPPLSLTPDEVDCTLVLDTDVPQLPQTCCPSSNSLPHFFTKSHCYFLPYVFV